MKRKLFSLMLIVLLVLVSGAVSAQEPQRGGTLVVAAESIGDSLDIGFWQGFGGLHIIDSIGEGLVQADFETATPGLVWRKAGLSRMTGWSTPSTFARAWSSMTASQCRPRPSFAA